MEVICARRIRDNITFSSSKWKAARQPRFQDLSRLSRARERPELRSRGEAGTRLLLPFPHIHASRILSVFEISVGLSVAASISAPQLTCIRSMKCNIKQYQGCYIVEGMCHCAKAFCCNNPFKYPSLDSCLANNTQQLGKLQTFWFRERLAVS